jgi:hypothetical protein
MEFNTVDLLSIKGGSALKHLIFRRQSAARTPVSSTG